MAKIKFVYILSQRYSGSTLLSFLLGTHPDISTIGERRKFFTHSFGSNPNKQSCSCGKYFQDCEHWNEIKKNVLPKINIEDYTTNPTEFRLHRNKYVNKLAFESFKFAHLNNLPFPFKKKIDHLCHFNEVLVEEILRKDGGSVFLDSSKIINHILFLSRIKNFDLSIIWLTRDPRAQVNSAMKYNQWTATDAAKRWKEEMIVNEKVLKKMNAKFMTLNYEALCRNPESEMTNIFDFLQMDASLFSLNFRDQEQHIMGNYNMRLGKDSVIEERTEWQDQLSVSDIADIEKITQDYRKYYSQTV